MKKSIPVLQKKRGRPATGVDPMLNFRSPKELTKALDYWVKEHPDPRPSRSEAMRGVLSDWLASRGFLKRRDSEGSN
jgi:Arc/MetJ-type ribon-helix-helix transcriptional regulator